MTCPVELMFKTYNIISDWVLYILCKYYSELYITIIYTSNEYILYYFSRSYRYTVSLVYVFTCISLNLSDVGSRGNKKLTDPRSYVTHRSAYPRLQL